MIKSHRPTTEKPAFLLELGNSIGTVSKELSFFCVKPGKEYCFSWEQKCVGQCGFKVPDNGSWNDKSKYTTLRDYLINFGDNGRFFWEKLVDFIGIEFVFFDNEGNAIKKERYPFAAETCLGLIGTQTWTNYVATRDDIVKNWTSGWFKFSPPENAEKLKPSFIIESHEKINAAIAIKDIKLKPSVSENLPLDCARFIIRIIDAENKNPISARMIVRDEKGCAFSPEYCFRNNLTNPFFYALPGETILDVPPGKYLFEAVKGFEYKLERTEAIVSNGVVKTIELAMKKVLDLKVFNWHNGDHHLHLSGHAKIDYPCMGLAEALQLGVADGMDYIPFQMEYIDSSEHENETINVEDAIAQYSTELVNHIWGHFCCIYSSKVLKRQICGHVLYPTMYDAVAEINACGGFCIAAHPYGMVCNPIHPETPYTTMAEGIGNPGRWNCAKELPLILLLGETCGYDLLATDNMNDIEFGINEYYNFLNFGFKLPLGGSTDTGANSADSLFPASRTFVKSENLSFQSISDAFRKGRSFATNGPVLHCLIDGIYEWGDTLVKNKDDFVSFDLKMFSPWGLSCVEIVYNGKSVIQKQLNKENYAEHIFEIKIDKPGWIAVVLKGPENKWLKDMQIAHTSPVYVKIEDEKFVPPVDLLDYFTLWIKNLKKIAEYYKEDKLKKNAEQIGITPDKAWHDIVENIKKAEAKISSISQNGWV